jgi:hypothetical protein
MVVVMDGNGKSTKPQLTEASEIFGTDYLAFMGDDADPDDDKEDFMGRRRDKYRERGVGVQYGFDLDEEDSLLSNDDDDDLFAADDDDATVFIIQVGRAGWSGTRNSD